MYILLLILKLWPFEVNPSSQGYLRGGNQMHYVRLRHQANIKMGTKSLPGWLGIPDHGVGLREVRGSNPRGTTLIFAPVFPADRLETRGELGLILN